MSVMFEGVVLVVVKITAVQIFWKLSFLILHFLLLFLLRMTGDEAGPIQCFSYWWKDMDGFSVHTDHNFYSFFQQGTHFQIDNR